ncbi:hypothetical protein CPB86DRAFT_790242 [Serendipita vermifera]|nr:hypothetical protein CPB86DRAFT_790242 [Serendipita vermifera]
MPPITLKGTFDPNSLNADMKVGIRVPFLGNTDVGELRGNVIQGVVTQIRHPLVQGTLRLHITENGGNKWVTLDENLTGPMLGRNLSNVRLFSL